MGRKAKDLMSVEEQVLSYFFKKGGKPVTITELSKELQIPRSTIVLHLSYLESDGMIHFSKKGKEKQYFPDEIAYKTLSTLITAMENAFTSTLVSIKKKELREIEKPKKRKKDGTSQS